jgi:hypothetical protein
MSADLRTISNFCFAWVAAYAMAGLFHAVLAVTGHIVRVSLPLARKSRTRRTWCLAVASALKHLARGAVVVFAVGVLTLAASLAFA